MLCNVCGSQLPASSTFCPQCGATLMPGSASETVIHQGSPIEQKGMPVSSLEENQPATTEGQYLNPPTPAYVPYQNAPQYYTNVVHDPYNAPPPVYSPPPPTVMPPQVRPPKKRGWRTAAIVGIIVVVMLGSCIGLSTALYNAINSGLRAASTTPSRVATPSTVSTPATQVTRSPIAQEPNPYTPFEGNLVLNDVLKDNSQGYQWNELNDDTLYCQFADNAYRLRLLPQSKYQIDWCFANNTNYSNFAFQVEMTMTKGDCGGLIFRNAGDRQLYYYCVTHEGGYGLYLYNKDNTGNVQVKELAKGDSPLIYTGYNIKNLLAVSANAGVINLYVNNKRIQTIQDTTFSHGEIGFATHQYDSKETDVSFQNAKLWTF